MAVVTIARAVQEENADAALVREAMRGDRAAFGALYEKHARAIHGTLLAHVSFSDAADLVHDVFLIAMQRIQDLREAGAFSGWLMSIARNRAREFHRRRRPEFVEELDRIAGHTPPPESFEALSAIRRLPECYSETLILRLVEGMTGPEIALRTGLTPESVRVNLCRGMKLLREALGTKS